jgi:ribonuclease T1
VSVFGRPLAWQTLRKLGLAFTVAGLMLAGQEGNAKEASAESTTVALSGLPKEAQVTQELIRAGGPFPYDKDGAVFGNRERQLPSQPRGHYREYTVKTPGSRDRAARRIVCGGRNPTDPEACYYSDDHYASFRRIVN